MNVNSILQSDLLDIIFENRNKAYGAYDLRKFYEIRLMQSIGFMLAAVGLVTVLTFLPASKTTELSGAEVTFAQLPDPLPPSKKLEIDPAKTERVPAIQKKQNGSPVVSEETADSIAEVDLSIKYGVSDVAGIVDGRFELEATGGSANAPITGDLIQEVAPVDLNKPVLNPDVLPEYPGGLTSLRKFLERNLKNPREMENGEKVSVKVRFVVGFDGKLKGFELIEDGGSEFNQEVMRVLKKMPSWIPGKANGHNVSVYHTIPVKFIGED